MILTKVIRIRMYHVVLGVENIVGGRSLNFIGFFAVRTVCPVFRTFCTIIVVLFRR